MSKVYKRQEDARKELDVVWLHPETVNVIHYSCESFLHTKDGASPRITSIAVRNLKTGQTQSFSVHKFGELKGVLASDISSRYAELERDMLDHFFKLVQERKEYKWVHWNMRDENFGFHALELRHRILGGEPFVIPDHQKFDLARIVLGIYGPDYAPQEGNGRLFYLMEKNKVKGRGAKSGAEEAELFKNESYLALHQSSLCKTDALSSICQLAYEGGLKTDAKFWSVYGHSMKAFISWFSERPLIVGISVFSNLYFFVDLIVRSISAK